MRQRRELFRINVHLFGQAGKGQEAVPCEILELTEKGVRLRTDLPATVGEELMLEFHLKKASLIRGTVLVTNSAPPYLGGRLTGLSPEHQQLLSRYIEQLIAMSMTGF